VTADLAFQPGAHGHHADLGVTGRQAPVLSPLISGEPITSTPKVLVIDQITFRNITLVVELTGAYMLFDQHAFSASDMDREAFDYAMWVSQQEVARADGPRWAGL
jgi:hypothetical protein